MSNINQVTLTGTVRSAHTLMTGRTFLYLDVGQKNTIPVVTDSSHAAKGSQVKADGKLVWGDGTSGLQVHADTVEIL